MTQKSLLQSASRLMIIAALLMSIFVSYASAQSAVGEFVVAVAEDLDSLDPGIFWSLTGNQVAGQVFDTLTTLPSGSITPQPGLADSWSVSADGLTWTFTLHPGVTFHNGEVFNAQAVVFNLNRWWDPANPYHSDNFDTFSYLIGYKDNTGGSLISAINAPDGSHVVIQLNRKDNLLPFYLTQTAFSIVSPSAITGGTFDQHPIGTGPFQFAERVPGDHTSLVANPTYWRQPPYLSVLNFKVIPDPAARFNALQSNLAHVAYDLPGTDYTAASSDLNLSVFTGYTQDIGYLGINSAHGPLGDLKVRRAIAHAINKKQLLQTTYDPQDQLADQFLPTGMLGYDPALAYYDYNPALARDLLAQAGYSNSIHINLTYRSVYRIYLRQPAQTAQAISADLAAVGIDATVVEMESNAFIDQVYAGELDLFLLGWGADYPHPSNFFTILCNVPVTPYGPRDNALCSTVVDANNATNPSEQETLFHNASQMVRDTLPLLPLSHGASNTLVRSGVSGLLPSFIAEDYETVYLTSGPNQPVILNATTTLQTHGDEAPITTIVVPPNAASEPMTLAYSLSESTNQPPADNTGLGAPFSLTAYQNAAPLPEATFAAPLEVTFDYTTYGGYRFDPATFELYINAPLPAGPLALETGWVKASSTCPGTPSSVLNQTQHSFTAYTCQTGQFALFGVQDRVPVFMPLVSR